MPNRLRVTGAGDERTLEVRGDEIFAHEAPDTTGGASSTAPGESTRLASIRDLGDGRYAIDAGGTTIEGVAASAGDRIWVSLNGRLFDFAVTPDRGAARGGARDADALSPPMSATVVRLAVAPGQNVHRGDTLVVLEAMKMELPIRAPRDAVVRAVHCREGDLVQPGTALVDLE